MAAHRSLPMDTSHSSRRRFLQTLAGAALAGPLFAQEGDRTLITSVPAKTKIGLDNFAVRAMGWKAEELIAFAAGLKCDALLISDLDSYHSLDDAHLRDVKQIADDHGLELYAGGWSICPTSKTFKDKWGTAEELVALGIRVAKALGSPVFRCVLGNAEDRKSEGGIEARIADTVKVLKASRGRALDAGVKIAVENHAGDMHSWELKSLIEDAGPDFVGANIDSGNAAWTLEDPMDVLETLGRHVICSSLRDDMIWKTDDGAAVQWTAVGDGLIDWPKYVERWRVLCPAVPVIIETISGFSRNFPYRDEKFWAHYDKRPERLAHFEALAEKGKAMEPFRPAEGVDRKKAEQDFQKDEITRSIKYLREKLHIGLKG